MASWLKTLPNKLTIARIAVIPFILLLYPINATLTNLICAILFLAAAFTDFFDGYLARKYKSESQLGALLDPIADKLIVTAALVMIASRGDLYGWVVALILCREVAISGIRLAALEKKISIEVSSFGKAKTVLLDSAIFLLLVGGVTFKSLGMIILWIGLFISYYSAYLYWSEFWEQLKTKSDDKNPTS